MGDAVGKIRNICLAHTLQHKNVLWWPCALLSSPQAARGWPTAILALDPLRDLAAPGQSHLTYCDLGFEHNHKAKAKEFCQHDKAEAGTFLPFGHLSLQFRGTPWAPLWAGWLWLVLWVPEKKPRVSTHFLASLLSMAPSLWGSSTSSQTHLPQVTDMLQMITTLCSLKTTAEGSQLQQISRRCMQQSWASYWRALCREVGLPRDLHGWHRCMG